MTLVDDLRRMTAAGVNEYTAGGATYWSDHQLTQILNNHRALMDFQEIEWHPQRISASAVEHKRGSLNTSLAFTAGTAGGTVFDAQGGTVSGWNLSKDGWVTFSADKGSDALYFSGWVYDLSAAAAEVCTSWAAAIKGLVDVTSDDQSLKLSQKRDALLAMAEEFQRSAPVKRGSMRRGDVV